MKATSRGLILSASDLVGHLSCRHLTALDLQLASGALKRPQHYDPLLELLQKRGFQHEEAYIAHLVNGGYQVTKIDGVDINDTTVRATEDAIRAGKQIITQAALRHGRWTGRADLLRRVDTPSALGDYSYEIIDTKLARETKGASVLQLCLYADLLSQIQGMAPENVYVVAPWSDYEPQVFRYADYAAYYRQVKRAADQAATVDHDARTYPDPNAHCDICRWSNECDAKRRADDHLCLVAGISKNQITELQANQVTTMQALSEMPLPLPFKPERGAPATFERARRQAAIQVQGRDAGQLIYETQDIEPGFGLAALPEPSTGDVFFDIEGNQFVGQHGLEYLFGYCFTAEDGTVKTISDWALDREGEKGAFERFIDFVTERRKIFPDMHVYHFGHYEPSALKRLMGRYATREDELDNLLRGLIFVDLLTVVRNALIASVENYSLKKLEPFFSFTRQTPLHDANVALTKVSAELELNEIPSIDPETLSTVERYNAEDCHATAELRDWLEQLRTNMVAKGVEVARPEPGKDAPSDELDEQQKRVRALIERLIGDVPVDPEARTQEQQARWVLAHIVDWHRRENKAAWWEHFRLADLTVNDLIDERAALARLAFVREVDRTARGIPTHRYRFQQQDTDLRGDEELRAAGGEKIGTGVAVSTDDRIIDIKKTKATAGAHPEAVYAHKVFDAKEQAAALFRLGEYVADHGIAGDGLFKSARDLLARVPPNLNGEPIQCDTESTLEAALRLANQLEDGVLPIQGPPGTGKSFTGARMICAFLKRGKKIGITANSHKVIRGLMEKVNEAAAEMGVSPMFVQKPASNDQEPVPDWLSIAKNNGDLTRDLGGTGPVVAGATSYFWSRLDASDAVDVLVVDEAAQMSLANVLAVAQAAPLIVLLGDPQQLDSPTQGSHPDGTDLSALDHVLEGHQTIPPEKGLFLAQTWRLNPDICAFNSELFYEGKLHSVQGCEQQAINSDDLLSGSGLRYMPVSHSGNTSFSIEEADAIKRIVEKLLTSKTQWTDRDGRLAPLTLADILIIAPYNAQVFELQQRLPGARIGTVDKFQGQEAPIAIYSMATSSHADAPRGMEFLYSANRFNVAISRAKCLAILVASPQIFEPECRTPRQMQLANAFCRFLELCPVSPPLSIGTNELQ